VSACAGVGLSAGCGPEIGCPSFLSSLSGVISAGLEVATGDIVAKGVGKLVGGSVGVFGHPGFLVSDGASSPRRLFPVSIPCGGEVASPSSKVPSMPMPSVPPVDSPLLLPLPAVCFPRLTRFVLPFTEASALSIPRLLAISIILSTSPLNVSVSSLGKRLNLWGIFLSPTL